MSSRPDRGTTHRVPVHEALRIYKPTFHAADNKRLRPFDDVADLVMVAEMDTGEERMEGELPARVEPGDGR